MIKYFLLFLFLISNCFAAYNPASITKYDLSAVQLNNFTNVTAPNTNNLVGVAYGETASMSEFCAVSGIVGTNGVLAGDIKGTSWIAGTTPANTKLYGVGWDVKSSKFFAVGINNSTSDALLLISNSSSCATFTSQTLPSPNGKQLLGVSANSSVAVAVGSITSGNTCAIFYSSNLTGWTASTITGLSCSGLSGFNKVVWNGTYFVAVGPGKSAKSTDGITWTVYSMTNHNWNSIAWNGKKFVSVSDDFAVGISSDGQTWTYGSTPALANTVYWNGVHFVAAANSLSTPDGLMYSIDGLTWKTARTPYSGWRSFASDGYMTVGVGYGDGSSKSIIKSLGFKF